MGGVIEDEALLRALISRCCCMQMRDKVLLLHIWGQHERLSLDLGPVCIASA